ncbi:MAG: hypothetical protein GY906_33700 [bacterium]|nr:hypothetical protein [bacterium]
MSQLLDGISQMDAIQLGGAALILVLFFVLIVSFASRARVFCQYLEHMTGIQLKPGKVKLMYAKGGRGAVRDMLIDLLIRQDLAADDRPPVTPDSKPDTGIFEIET